MGRFSSHPFVLRGVEKGKGEEGIFADIVAESFSKLMRILFCQFDYLLVM